MSGHSAEIVGGLSLTRSGHRDAFAETGFIERHLGLPDHCGLMLAARITFAHISISATMRVANSFGVLATRS